MDKKMAGLLGAAAALVTVGAGNASATPIADPAPVTGYRDLLEPIPEALALLKLDDETRAQEAASVQVAQYHHHHHHHHHHHGIDPGAAIIGGVVGGILGATQPGYYGPPPGPCYWTLGRPYWNGYAWVRPRVRVCE